MMSALPKEQGGPVSDLYPALLLDPSRFVELAEMFSGHVDLSGHPAEELSSISGVDLVVIDLSQSGATDWLDTIARQAPETKVLVIGDALPAPAVRAMLRLQSSDLASLSAGASDIVAAAGRLAQTASDGTARPTQCWVTTGAVGGAGATTVAIELACAAAAQDPANQVCIIDLNLADGMVASYLEGEPRLDLVSLSDAPDRLDPTLLSAYVWEHETGVNLVAAPRNPDINEVVTSDLILRLLDTVCTVYTHVIVDMPRTRQSWSKPILSGADQVMVVSEFTVPSLHAAADMCREIDALRSDSELSKLVLNRMSDSKTEFSVSRASKAIERDIGAVVRSDWKSARAAVNLGMPIQTVKPKSKLVRDVMTLMKQLNNEGAGLQTGVASS
ncbi:MAG: hypothetical protein AAF683_13565 [Pseudomonadota bacterium]